MSGSRFATATARVGGKNAKEKLINLGSVYIRTNPTEVSPDILVFAKGEVLQSLPDVARFASCVCMCLLCLFFPPSSWFESPAFWLDQLMPGVASGFPLAGIAARRPGEKSFVVKKPKWNYSWMLMNWWISFEKSGMWFPIDHSIVPKCSIHFGVLVSSCSRFCFERIQKAFVLCGCLSCGSFFRAVLRSQSWWKKQNHTIQVSLPSCCWSSLLQQFPFFKMGLFMALAEGLDCNTTTWKSRRFAEDEWLTVMIYCTLMHFAWYAVLKSHEISKENQSRHASNA